MSNAGLRGFLYLPVNKVQTEHQKDKNNNKMVVHSHSEYNHDFILLHMAVFLMWLGKKFHNLGPV